MNIIFEIWYFFPLVFQVGALAWIFSKDSPAIILQRFLIWFPLSNVAWIIGGALK